MAGHISDDDLERYAIGTVKDEAELEALEKHLLVCGWCIDRAENAEGYVEAMRAALKRLRAKVKGGKLAGRGRPKKKGKKG
mgnify:CR=1 FL=1